MTIHVKFFARLREQLGTSAVELEHRDGLSVLDVWQLSTENTAFPANTLCAINMDYVDSAAAVNDDDEVAFFPPVTGG